MLKLFSVSASAVLVTAFSGAVLGHSLGVPHSHDGAMLQTSLFWVSGIVALFVLNLIFLLYCKKIK